MSVIYIIPVDSNWNFINGMQIPIDSCAKTYVYDGEIVETITVEWMDGTYIQTYTNDGTNITSVTGWVLQE